MELQLRMVPAFSLTASGALQLPFSYLLHTRALLLSVNRGLRLLLSSHTAVGLPPLQLTEGAAS